MILTNRESVRQRRGTEERVPLLSIVIPAYNEAGRLPLTLQRLHSYLSAQSYDWEIIVVSNGSTDGTEEVILRAAERIAPLRLIALEQRGKGVATRCGALASRGEVVFLCDADLSMPPETLAAFLHALQSADVVIGSREVLGARRFDEPRQRHMMGRVFNRLVQLLAVPGVEDTQCGFKAFHRSAARQLFTLQTLAGFGFDVELLYLARKYGYSMAELGIDWYYNPDSRVRPGVDSLAMLLEVVQIRLRDMLGRYRAEKAATPSELEARGRSAA